MAMTAERRFFTRCNIERGDFYVFSHEDGIIGKLRNIGPKGAAYQYTPFSGQAAKDTSINITAADPNGFHILDHSLVIYGRCAGCESTGV